jgi:hypothetical protein
VVGIVPGHRSETILEAFDLLGVTLSVDTVRKVVARVPGVVFIIDEFDRCAKKSAQEFTDLVKALSDFAVDCTIVLVGVSDTIDALIADHASITRAVVQIFLPRMEANELREILTKAEKALTVGFSVEAANLIVHISQGLPHYTHLLGLHAVRIAAKRLSAMIERDDVFEALKQAASQAQQSVTEKHSKAVHSAHRDALYRQVLLACALTAAKAHDPLGFFNPGAVAEPLSTVLGRPVEIATFNNHLSDFCQDRRGSVLEKIGQPRSYRFRFTDPLLVPFVFMDAVTTGLISVQKLAEELGAQF